MTRLRISVIVPTYNRANLIARGLDSALVQLEAEDELIVIDDGSSDNTEDVIKPYLNRIKYIRTENQGAGKARNRGVAEAGKELLAFLDSDDEWMPGKLKIQREFMRACPEILYCFSDLAYRGADGRIDRFTLKNWFSGYPHPDEILESMGPYSALATLPEGMSDFNCYRGSLYGAELSANYINVNTLIVRRLEAGQALHFAEDTPTYEDWEFNARIAGAGQGAYLECETAWQHGHGGPRLTDADHLAMAEARIKIIERIWGQDRNFLEKNAQLYKNVFNQQRLIAAKSLIACGKTQAARGYLRSSFSVPKSYRILASLPGFMVRGIVGLRAKMRGK